MVMSFVAIEMQACTATRCTDDLNAWEFRFCEAREAASAKMQVEPGCPNRHPVGSNGERPGCTLKLAISARCDFAEFWYNGDARAWEKRRE